MENKGRVIRRMKGFYSLVDQEGRQVECKVKGKLFQSSKYNNQIAVGDWVLFRPPEGEDHGLIHAIENRQSFLSRSRVGIEAEQVIAANVDKLIILLAAKNPDPHPGLIHRMLVAATRGMIQPVLVITKSDLARPGQIESLFAPFRALEIPLLTSSIHEPLNPRILEELTGAVSVFSGPSGVGKSSLLNQICPQLDLRVGQVSHKTNKGAHTTTYAEMHQILPGSFVIDTPGVREFSLWGVTRQNLAQHYPLLNQVSGCHFDNCTHAHEPKCQVRRLVKEGKIPQELLDGYLSIWESLGG